MNSKVYIIGGVTTAVAAGVYIFWGPSQRNKGNGWIRGLQNLGNTCFLNSVLQALAPCSSLISWISFNQSESAILTSALYNVLSGLNNESSSQAIHPTQVLTALQSHRWMISNDEQDAHELFHVLTTTLQEEVQVHRNPVSILDVQEIEKLQSSETLASGIVTRVCGCVTQGKPVTPLPTRGLLSCRLTCTSCGFRKPVRYDSFDSVSLTLPERFAVNLKLEQCLKQWASPELVPDVICRGCSKRTPGTKQKSTFTKQLCFGRLPSCLCLHLIRTVWLPTGTPYKRFEQVYFPEYLSLSDYLSLPSRSKVETQRSLTGLIGGTSQGFAKNLLNGHPVSRGPTLSASLQNVVPPDFKSSSFGHMYQLRSVIVHLGDAFSGHFMTYRRGPKSSSWFCVSDLSVHQVPFAEVFKASAYMLFYEKL